MVGRIIFCICCILCFLPFYFITFLSSDGPISFWTGDESLKDKVIHVKEYNCEMVKLYKVYAIGFLVSAFLVFIDIRIALLILILQCTTHIYWVYKKYKKILEKYSK